MNKLSIGDQSYTIDNILDNTTLDIASTVNSIVNLINTSGITATATINTSTNPWGIINAPYTYPTGTGTIPLNNPNIQIQQPITTWGNNTWINGSTFSYSSPSNPLADMTYRIVFNVEDGDKLETTIKAIRKNKMKFSCAFDDKNRIQPYEFIMKLIATKKKFSVQVHVSDILTINYHDFRFTKIVNNIDFNNSCDFSVIKVKFEYEKILFENHKLSDKQKRIEKLNKILGDKSDKSADLDTQQDDKE